MLSKAGFFKSLAKRDLGKLSQLLHISYRPAGDLIFEEGDPGRAMYILIVATDLLPGSAPDEAHSGT